MTFVAPPGYQPVYNPSIPYLGPIYGGLREGSSIYIQGSIPENITRFQVNLLCGQSDSSDIALHCNPRFDGWDKVVFNTRQNDSWGSEDKIRSMPFCKGERFEMVIKITSQGYQIRVNGNDFHTFPHRMPVERVGGLQIAGDVVIQTINVIGGGMGGGYPGGMGGGMGGGYPGGMGGGMGGGYPGGTGGGMGGGYPGGTGGGMGGGYPGGNMGGGYPEGNMGGGYPGGNMGGGYPGGNMGGGCPGGEMGGGYPGSTLPGMGGQPIYNPPVPYQGMISGGMFPKRTIIIRGLLPFGATRMAINFVVSRTRDIAFHLNPRLRDGLVIRNSKIGGNWGNEERELNFNPFAEGQYFDMSIRCGNQRFKVFVNGQHMFDFSHRMQSFNEIDRLEIEGDVQISYIHF